MSKLTIICVDDESIVLNALSDQIMNEFRNELTVETAESGLEALEVLDELLEDKYDIPIVIADFIMPGMTGDELLTQIYQRSPDTKSIMLTGQASLEGVGNAINNAHLYRFLSKPWNRDDLLLTIREALSSYKMAQTIVAQNTELKELNVGLEEKVAQRTKELEELNATKDKFFSIIAHDLKNPFNTLMGFSELLIEHFESFPPEKIRDYIKILFDTSKNSYALLENLLEWSRSQTGRIKNEPQNIELHFIVHDTIALLTNQAEKKNIQLLNGLLAEDTVFADENMIRTVIRNLMSNAIKYTNEGGNIAITSTIKDNQRIIKIRDSGIGISPENIEKLFRIDTNYTTHGTADESGTGLGLILCKEFVEKNNGTIWVESELGKGSVFSFSLPIKGT